MKPYAVEVSFTMIVMAEDETHAHDVARENENEAWHESTRDYAALGPIHSEKELNLYGWNGDCFPYGECHSRLKDILASLELDPGQDPLRDVRTGDLFSEVK